MTAIKAPAIAHTKPAMIPMVPLSLSFGVPSVIGNREDGLATKIMPLTKRQARMTLNNPSLVFKQIVDKTMVNTGAEYMIVMASLRVKLLTASTTVTTVIPLSSPCF